MAAAVIGMLLASAQRGAFNVLIPQLQQDYSFTLPQLSMLQSIFLLGYIILQVPAGKLCDTTTTTLGLGGGLSVMIAALFLWSITTFAHSFVAISTNNNSYLLFKAFLFLRFLEGLAQAVIMPAVSNIASQYFPPSQRASKTSLAYGAFSIGTVIGLWVTPYLCDNINSSSGSAGWTRALSIHGLIGMTAAILLAIATALHPPPKQPSVLLVESKEAGLDTNTKHYLNNNNNNNNNNDNTRDTSISMKLLALLCLTHGVIGYTFFILQAWIPTFIYPLVSNKQQIGRLSAIPWVFTAITALLAGRLCDWLQNTRGLSSLQVRRLAQSIASTLGGVSLLALLLFQHSSSLVASSSSATGAMICLTVAVAAQGFNYSGFHTYVQQVAPQDAGVVLGITNTCSVACGILSGLVVAYGGFEGAFLIGAVLHLVSLATFLMWAKGDLTR